jgi:hypothetical protein
MKTIAFKFCGGCNPLYDRSKVYRDVREALSGRTALVDNDCRGQILIILNGCRSGCIKSAEYQDYFGNVINTQNYLTAFQSSSAEDIIKWINENII